LKKTAAEVLEMAATEVAHARKLCADVEFSPMDATRTDLDYLAEIVQATIEAGATTINIPDTVGYATPWEMQETIAYLFEHVANIDQCTISVHCHDDLGMSVANSLAAVKAGAMGERAGNASLEEIVMALVTRGAELDATTNVRTRQIIKTSRMVSNLTGFVVQHNKAIVGENAFAHESGIHQHGVIMNRQTYEIMRPEDVGLAESVLTLGRRSGRHGLRQRLEELGYKVGDDQLDAIYERFLVIADKKKQVYDEDLQMIMHEATAQVPEVWELISLETTSGGTPTATVTLRKEDETYTDDATGNGPVDAAYQAIERITGVSLELEDYSLRSISIGKDAVGEATVKVRHNGQETIGKAASTDVIEASARAYLNAVNRLLVKENQQ